MASSTAVDSHGEIVEQDWNLDRYKANPVVFFGHESWELPIGKAEDVRIEGDQLRARIVLVSEKANPRAEQVLQFMREEALRGVSVGFRPGRVTMKEIDGKKVRHLGSNELLELSIVGIPANVEGSAKGDENKETSTMDDEMIDLAVASLGVKALGEIPAAADKLKMELDGLRAKAARCDQLETQMAELVEGQRTASIDTLAKELCEAGKLTPASRDEFVAKARVHGVEWARSMGEFLPVLVSKTAEAPKPPSTEKPAVDAEIAAALKAAGLSVDDYNAAKEAGFGVTK